MALEMRNFIEISKPDHLTIGDFKQLRPGDALDVVIWDRNFEESWIWSSAEKNRPYVSTEFFANNMHQLVVKDNLSWDIHYPWGGVVEHPIHVDVSALNDKWKWAPIENGRIQVDESFLMGSKALDSQKIHNISWGEFPDSTRVGWRGPIMLWEKLTKYPMVYLGEKE